MELSFLLSVVTIAITGFALLSRRLRRWRRRLFADACPEEGCPGALFFKANELFEGRLAARWECDDCHCAVIRCATGGEHVLRAGDQESVVG